MGLQKVLENKFIRLFSLKRNSKTFLMICFLISFSIFDLSKAASNNPTVNKKVEISIDNLDSKSKLEKLNFDSERKKLITKNIKDLGVDYIKSKKRFRRLHHRQW